MEIRRLGVMGGTFDPIHIGHLIAASEVLHSIGLERVMFVPTGQPWQKKSFTDSEDRYLMTVLGAATDTRFVVSRAEIDRRGPTYTIDTMRALKEFHGGEVELYFIAGADAVLRLGTWHDIEGLQKLVDIVAVTRPGSDLSELTPEPHWPRIRVVEMPGIDISATDIRERVRAGKPVDYLVPRAVAHYIRAHGLYVGEKRA